MKLRDEDKTWLTNEVSRVVTESIREKVEQFQPHGWRRVSRFIREWGIAGTILTVFVALLALAASQFYYANQRIKQETEFETNTKTDLATLKSDLHAIQGDLARTSLTNHAALPLDDFKSTSPILVLPLRLLESRS